MKRLPSSLKKYFWDTDFSKLDRDFYSQFIIGRILEHGDEGAVKWLFRYFKRSELKNALRRRQNISPLSANYWRLILNIPRNKILCLQRRFQNKLQKTWLY